MTESKLPTNVDASAMPKHYASHRIDPIDIIDEYKLNFNCGNTVKYIARHQEKAGREDLLKGLYYLLHELGVPRERIHEILPKIRNGEPF